MIACDRKQNKKEFFEITKVCLEVVKPKND